MEHQFEIGDCVMLVKETHGNQYLHIGSVGTVVGHYNERIIRVIWDEWCDGHSCNNRGPDGYGWNVSKSGVVAYGDPAGTTDELPVGFDELL